MLQTVIYSSVIILVQD